MYADFLPLQKQVLSRSSDVIPGVAAAVAELRAMAARIGSSTGYTRELMDVVEPIAAGQGYAPDCTCTADEVAAGRPAPLLNQLAAERLGVSLSPQVVVVDDTLVGIEAGLRSGCTTIGVSRTGNLLGLTLAETNALSDDELQARLAAWAVVPFGPEVALANINAGLLFLMAITSLEVYGVIIAGWASNSKYAFLGALRASAQMVSYEIAMGFCLVVVLMVAGTMNLVEIVMTQGQGRMAEMGLGFLSWNWLPLLPIFVVFFIAGLAETNRHPFDVVEGESEIVAGHMIEYSGMSFAMFFLAEYANMLLVSTMCVVLFLGGWLPPVEFLSFIPGWIWLAIKVFVVVTMFLWVRATFPRYRYDQIMRLGWKIFIPVTLVWLVVVGLWIQSPLNIWP